MPTINFKKKQIYTRGVVKKKRDSAKKGGEMGPACGVIKNRVRECRINMWVWLSD